LLGAIAGTSASVSGLLPNTVYNWYVVPNNGSDAIGCNVNNTITTLAEPNCVPNNACANATAIGTAGNGGTVNSTTVGASISRIAEICGGATGIADDDVWFRFTTDANGGDVTIALTAAAASLDAVIQVYSGTCGALVNIGCADATGDGGNETVTLNGLAAGTQYLFRVYGWDGFVAATPTSGSFTLTTSGTGLDGSVVLPVTLTSFDAKIQDQDAVISWKVQSELNNKGFEIQRSADGRNFTGIGFVNSRGNTNSERSYSFTDPRVVAGVYHYYRLKQIDLDDRFTHSSIARVRLSAPGTPSMSVFPNPAQHILQVTFDRVSSVNTTVQVIDIRGRSIQQQQMPGGANKTSINVERLPAGVYFVRISTADHTEQVRFVKD
jgi:hypothetical protein